ncbi:hypothetical protein BK133_18690 [Paenibacillus sp. FSL H8-0548]|uniref:Wadjet anti-phage system protein JetD domain-containing protein n=1 Tax=Paenibacillus sp. FSL H8-0548 TaxID=1920422 RepID=UPI00096E3149|nr:Wadjet anti-phage system protein JetD domain-containing protein [Paenibacillus sp. FSL H8-0548]OMF28680.1 hypothetical protein BK133_18690 [Paenibacillus sp. FSL H8-0548]
MPIRQQIESYLSRHKKQTISLAELEGICSASSTSYQELGEVLMSLEASEALQMVKAQGRNGKQPSLAYNYRINKSKFKLDLHRQLQQARLQLHPHIRIDAYYSLPAEAWQQDEPRIRQIDEYLRRESLPEESVPAPERSFALVGDEKWITENNGMELLERIGLWSSMRIISVADPLMLAFNPQQAGLAAQLHLIVENKTTYQGLLPALADTQFSTLIYGCGKKIIKSIELFELQLPLPEARHNFYYFGDIDHEGINIWASLNERMKLLYQSEARLALPFYRACLAKENVFGKETQRRDLLAVEAFSSHFTEAEQASINSCLASGGYYPQEILKTAELKALWRSAAWII